MLEFFMPMKKPPTTTHQQKQVTIIKGKPVFYEPDSLKAEAQQVDEFPQVGDEYWRIDDKGSVDNSLYNDYYGDHHRQAIGNFFKTEKEAHFAVEKLKVEAELRKLSDSWDLENTQYTFSFDWEFGEFNLEYPDYNQYPNSYYFYSIGDLQQTIETVGVDRIKKYIFGVED